MLFVRSRGKDFAVGVSPIGDSRVAARPRPNKCLDQIFFELKIKRFFSVHGPRLTIHGLQTSHKLENFIIMTR